MKKQYLVLMIVFILSLLTACSEELTEEQLNPDNEPIFEYENKVEGYKVKLLGEYEIDESLQGLYTRLTNDTTTVDIYYDDFNGTIDNKDTYFNYGNQAVLSNPDHKIIEQDRENYKNLEINRVLWERPKLARVENDKNFYASYEIAINKLEVVTIMVKSTEPNKDYEFIKRNFEVIEKSEKPKEFKYNVVSKQWDEETQRYYDDTFINSDRLQFGIFDAMKFTENEKTLALEEKLDYKFNTLLRYQNIGESAFPMEEMIEAYNEGRTVELTLQSNRSESILYKTLDGTYDEYLTEYAKQVAEFGKPVLFRLNNEMNGDWVYYSTYHNSKDPELYVKAWQYVHSFFEAAGADNVLWVWNPNHHSKPNFKWNHTLAYYPGSEYIDVVGLTAYNTGIYHEGEEWTDFETLYDEIYYQYEKWFDHPFMITEFSSSSIGGDKVEWINDMFKVIDKYDRIKIALLWSWQDLDANGNPARIYFVDENEETTEAFRKGLENY